MEAAGSLAVETPTRLFTDVRQYLVEPTNLVPRGSNENVELLQEQARMMRVDILACIAKADREVMAWAAAMITQTS